MQRFVAPPPGRRAPKDPGISKRNPDGARRFDLEKRVAASPATVALLKKAGFKSVLIQSDARRPASNAGSAKDV
jgi:hypothetical protein